MLERAGRRKEGGAKLSEEHLRGVNHEWDRRIGGVSI